MGTALKSILKDIFRIPPLPRVSLEVQELASREGTDPAEICQRLETEPALCARVLQLANSPVYGFVREISTLEEAGNLLGNRCLANLALTSAAARCFRGSSGSSAARRQAAWERALQTAIVARLVAKLTKHADPSRSYTAALLCDLGSLAMIEHYPVESVHLEPLDADPERCLERERELFGMTHAEAGGILFERWKMPDTLVECARLHHAPDQARRQPEVSRVIHLACELTMRLRGQDADTPLQLNGQELDGPLLARLQEQYAAECTKSQSLWTLR